MSLRNNGGPSSHPLPNRPSPVATGSNAPLHIAHSPGAGSLPSAPVFSISSFPLSFHSYQDTSIMHKDPKKMSNIAIQTASPLLPISFPVCSEPTVTLPRNLPSNMEVVQHMYADLFDSFQHVQGERWASDTMVKDMHIQFETLQAENQHAIIARIFAE
ncbi:hypothetical protein GYMLUDRAFT_252687 [Collybiopsis luxurians FD-317 M1]|uniref:Uncharacterized protein n=1 Tax=Collybiopsis luxurians FD-317 M1 TaxID=944289 RepID=A0A0D0AKJ8_9AGAR|nr:hypothetical protein GYMLUDRAFT_252687 [Collybiopsis luxurians FD-317 M1]